MITSRNIYDESALNGSISTKKTRTYTITWEHPQLQSLIISLVAEHQYEELINRDNMITKETVVHQLMEYQCITQQNKNLFMYLLKFLKDDQKCIPV